MISPIKISPFSRSTAPSGVAPANTVTPVVSGTLEVGETLTSTTGTWTGTPTITYSYQWKRGVTNIGANQNTYIAVIADEGQSITCVVTATNDYGSENATSNAIVIELYLQTIFDNYTGRNQWATQNSTIVSTTTTWIDYALAHNVANPAAGNQPTRNDPDTDFNSKKTETFITDDYLIKNTANYGAGQTTGSLWAVVKTGASFAANPAIFSVNNTANVLEKLALYIDTTGKITVTIHNGLIANTLVTTNALSLNSKYIIEVETNGTTTSVYVNGVLQVLVGTNSGLWFSYANTGSTLDNVVIGALIRASANIYMDGKIAYVGNFTLPSAGNRTAMLNALNSYYGVY